MSNKTWKDLYYDMEDIDDFLNEREDLPAEEDICLDSLSNESSEEKPLGVKASMDFLLNDE